VGLIVCYALYDPIFQILSRPLTTLERQGAPPAEGNPTPLPSQVPESSPWLILNPLEPFLVRLKLAAVAGTVVALPYIVYQLCAFVFPGLKPNERRAARILILGCSLLVVIGVGVAYFGVLPLVLPYLVKSAPVGVEFKLRMSETVAQILKFLLGFAIAFQFPMVVWVLVYLGLLKPATLKRYRREAILGLACIAAVFTPPEPISMLLMLIPLVLLYEGSIWVGTLTLWLRKTKTRVAL